MYYIYFLVSENWGKKKSKKENEDKFHYNRIKFLMNNVTPPIALRLILLLMCLLTLLREKLRLKNMGVSYPKFISLIRLMLNV